MRTALADIVRLEGILRSQASYYQVSYLFDKSVEVLAHWLTCNGFPLQLAVAAETEDSKAVTSWLKPVLHRDLILLVLNDLTVELDEQAAIGADQMVVMLVVI